MTQTFISTTPLRYSEQIKRHLRPVFHDIFQLLSHIICITGMRYTLVYVFFLANESSISLGREPQVAR